MPKKSLINYALNNPATGVETVITFKPPGVVILGARFDWYAATSSATSAQRIKLTVTPVAWTPRRGGSWLASATMVYTKGVAYNGTASLQTIFYPPGNQGFMPVTIDGFKVRFSRGSSTKGNVVNNLFMNFTTEGDGAGF